MKYLALVILLTISSLSFAQPAPHDHLSKHGMLLYGHSEVFASHIVYKQPHNFQVILQLKVDEATRATLHAARLKNPENILVFVLNPLDLNDIPKKVSLSGPVVSKDTAGNAQVVVPTLTLAPEDYKIIYFNELPISLNAR